MNSLINTGKKTIKNWWILLILGILIIAAGVVLIANPKSSIIFLTCFFSVSFLVVGIFEIAFALSNTYLWNWGWHLAGGILDLFLGIILLSSNIFSQMWVLAFFIGFWVLFKGISLIGHSFDIKRLGLKSWGWLLFLGILGVIFSFIIMINPFMALATLPKIPLVNANFLSRDQNMNNDNNSLLVTVNNF